MEQIIENREENRRIGQPMSDDKLQSLDPNTLIGRVPQFIRTDFGGEDHKERIALQRALVAQPGLAAILSKLSAEEQKLLGAAVVGVAQHACEGSRKRLHRTVEEMRRRWGTPVSTSRNPESSCLKI